MRRIAILFSLVFMCLPTFAQNHGEVGAFFDYFRPQATKQNLYGVGGRLSVNLHPSIALEGEGAYDFEQSQTSVFNTGTNTTTVRTNLRTLHLLFGPKFQIGGNSPVRLFATAKGGFVRFGVNNLPVTPGTVINTIQIPLTDGDVNGVFYPGVGAEVFLGPIGIRADAGDEIYFSNGANHNFKFTIGPHIRF